MTLTRDQLLVLNAMAFLEEHIDCPEIAQYMAAFERDEEARNGLMSALTQEADDGFQRTFTVPPIEDQN